MKRYTIGDYTNLLKSKDMIVESNLMGSEDFIIDYLTFNSKKAKKGTLFICKGAAFKKDYLDDAISLGASIYVSEVKYETEEKNVPYIIVKNIREAMPLLAELYTDKAWEKLKIVGVGGTKGKSTSAYYMKAIVDDYMAATGGKESAVISSIDVYDGVVLEESHITTPEAVELHEHFSNAVNSGIEYLQMEVSSQALKYNRVDNMMFDVGIFLNISEDHISDIEHPDFEDYFSSKLKMFEKTKNAVVNLDADFSDRTVKEAQVCEKVLTTSVSRPEADIYAYNIHKDGLETVFMVKTADFDEEFRLSMPGLFNVENALGVIGAAIFLGIPLEYMKSGLHRAKSSGRMELYASDDNNLIAVVDYAHNKLSFEKLFSSIKAEYPDYHIVSIFGCPGNKAILRRRDLGIVAGQNSSKIYLTAEDPGAEPFDKITKEIAAYVEGENCPYETIEDRGEAIKTAMDKAEPKTILLVTGKGNETRQKYGSQYIDCKSDVEYVKEFLDEYNKKSI